MRVASQVSKLGDGVVVGELAIALHGVEKSVGSIDLSCEDRWETHLCLEDIGVYWNQNFKAHEIDGVAVTLVPRTLLGLETVRGQNIAGIRVLTLAELVESKLHATLESLANVRHLADLVEIIQQVPEARTFGDSLSKQFRDPYLELCSQLAGRSLSSMNAIEFWKKYA